MDMDVLIQYCGPYSIQTSDAPKIQQSIENISIVVERGQLQEIEHSVVQKNIQDLKQRKLKYELFKNVPLL